MRSISRACRRGDQVGAFAAVHESESGTFETCPRYLKMSSSLGRPEVISARPERRDWTPKKDIAAELTREGRRWVHDPALRLPARRDEPQTAFSVREPGAAAVSSPTRRSHRSRSAIPVAREPPLQAWLRPTASAMPNAYAGVLRASASRPLGSGRRQA